MTAPPPANEVQEAGQEAPRRADAIRNREKVIAAAEQVFSEQGVDAGIPEIAERAGVGKGTIYRNFETKDDLVAAILIRRMTLFDQEIREALEAEDPGLAFRKVLLKAATRVSDLSFPAGIYWPGRSPELDRVKAETKGRMSELVRKSQKAGVIRKDATADEVWILFGGVCRILGDTGEKDPAVWRRSADLVADAFMIPVGR